ncbi:DDE-type integrase/transposase/recombinase [Desulfovibrio sp.]|uniref:DDE-type integrase/transposase/recombinase n=1 Tax=Desulfovibrio sp. TaxID=885 RepID=UPI002618D9B9|nr:DDE-type integrase/transposase/recombinase [Desulfovibrio sp.]
METSYSALQLSKLAKVNKATIHRWAKDELWPGAPRKGVKGGGIEWKLSDLPPKRQKLFRTAIAYQLALETASKQIAKPVNIRKGQYHSLNGLPEHGQSKAAARAFIVNVVKQIQQETGKSISDVLVEFALLYKQREAPVPDWVYEHCRTASRSGIRDWMHKMEKEGMRRLAKQHEKRRPRNLISNNEKLLTFTHGMLELYPHISGDELRNAAVDYFGPHGKQPDASVQIPSVRRYQVWLKQWKLDNEQLYAHMLSPDAWRSKYKMALGSADAHIIRLNQEWQADSTKADIMLNDGKRYVIVAFIDVYSRRVCFFVSPSSTAAAVASCFYKALQLFGVPEILKTDNGSDYVSQHIQRLLASLGIFHDVCPPFTPEAKPHVERVFRTLSHSLFELLPGFVGHNVAQRTDIEARNSFANRLFDKNCRVELPLSLDELKTFLDQWASTIYGDKPHSGINDQSPNARAAAYTGEVARIEDERALDVLLMPCPGNGGIRTVTKKGVRVTRQQHGLALGGYYIGTDLAALDTRKVLVRMYEGMPGRVFLFDPQTSEYLGKADHPSLMGLTDEDVRLAAIAAGKTQKAWISKQRAAMKKAAKLEGLAEIGKIRLAAAQARHEALQQNQPAENTTSYTTPQLEQATRVYTGDFVQTTPEEHAEAVKYMEKFDKPQNSFVAPVDDYDGVQVWMALYRELMKGGDVADEAFAWMENYRQHNGILRTYIQGNGIDPNKKLKRKTKTPVLAETGVQAQ